MFRSQLFKSFNALSRNCQNASRMYQMSAFYSTDNSRQGFQENASRNQNQGFVSEAANARNRRGMQSMSPNAQRGTVKNDSMPQGRERLSGRQMGATSGYQQGGEAGLSPGKGENLPNDMRGQQGEYRVEGSANQPKSYRTGSSVVQDVANHPRGFQEKDQMHEGFVSGDRETIQASGILNEMNAAKDAFASQMGEQQASGGAAEMSGAPRPSFETGMQGVQRPGRRGQGTPAKPTRSP